MKNNLSILCDIDDTVSDFMNYFILTYNSLFNKQIKYNDISDSLELILGEEAFYETMKEIKKSEGIKNLPIIPGAIEFIENLRKTNKKIIFVTAPTYFIYPNWVDERMFWLQKYFNCNVKDVVFAHDKNLVQGDILIDDRPKFLNAWNSLNKTCIRMVKPWNKKSAGHPANNFDDALKIINKYKESCEKSK
jgi:5'-nucleotidase